MENKNKKLTVAGLHLWAVELSDFDNLSLLITTRSSEIEVARAKAQKFLNGNRDKYTKSEISGIRAEGVIDA